jgi:tetratricopeptide (TPR) repeat protein
MALADVERDEWQFAAAESEYTRALELNPNLGAAHLSYGVMLVALGRFNEALEHEQRTLDLDPLDPLASLWVGQIHGFQGDYDECIAQAQKVLDIDPSYMIAHFTLVNCYHGKGMDKESVDALAQLLTAVGAPPQVAADLKQTFATGGMKAVLRIQLERSSNPADPGYDPLNAAQAYCQLGDKDKAFSWLNKAYEAREISLMNLKVDPVFAPLRSDPRYADLVRRIGFPQ